MAEASRNRTGEEDQTQKDRAEQAPQTLYNALISSQPNALIATQHQAAEERLGKSLGLLARRAQACSENVDLEHFPTFPQVVSSDKSHTSSKPGLIGRLPLELMHEILLHVDLATLGKFARLNSSCKAAVESMIAFRELAAFAAGTLDALSVNGLLGQISAFELQRKLYKRSCEFCGEHEAPFMSLLNYARCCHKCLKGRQVLETKPIPIMDASMYFGVDPDMIAETLPNAMVETEGWLRSKGPRKLVSYQAVRDLVFRDPSNGPTHEQGGSRTQERLLVAPNDSPPAHTIGWIKLVCNEGRWRCQVAAPFPYLDKETKSLEVGFGCETCEGDWGNICRDIIENPRLKATLREPEVAATTLAVDDEEEWPLHRYGIMKLHGHEPDWEVLHRCLDQLHQILHCEKGYNKFLESLDLKCGIVHTKPCEDYDF